jgi:DNA-binding LacI/PurR family transcriptional regulator
MVNVDSATGVSLALDDVLALGHRRIAVVTSAFTVPALTTVRMPTREMAALAVQIAFDARPEGPQPTVEVLRPGLVIRESTGPSPQRDARSESASTSRSTAPA